MVELEKLKSNWNFILSIILRECKNRPNNVIILTKLKDTILLNQSQFKMIDAFTPYNRYYFLELEFNNISKSVLYSEAKIDLYRFVHKEIVVSFIDFIHDYKLFWLIFIIRLSSTLFNVENRLEFIININNKLNLI